MAGYRVEICGVNTAKLPLLKAAEKEELILKIKQGNKEAREEYIKGNLRLVLSIIQRFSSGTENVDDLFQIGCIGLMKAIDNFDISQGVKFSTYAVPMIIGEIRRYLRDNNSIRVSRSLRDIAYKALYTKDVLQKTMDREPTLDEIAKESGIPREDIMNALDAIQVPMSLYEPVFSENGDSLYVIDQLSDTSRDSIDESWLENIALREAVRTLTPREQKIIHLRYYKDKTQMEIASEIGISQAQVSRVEKAALEKLRKQL